MSCPSQGIIDKIITFTMRVYDSEGEPISADSPPLFDIYEEEIELSNIVDGYENVEMIESSSSQGLYYANILVDESKFDEYKTYIIDIQAQVSGASLYRTYTFVALGEDNYNIVYDDSMDTNIKASLSTRGSLRQGDFGIFLLMLSNLDTSPINVDLISFSIWQGSDEVVSETSVPLQVGDGKYVYEWKIPTDTPLGSYIAHWEYEIDGEIYDIDQVFTVRASSAQAKSKVFYNLRRMQLRAHLEDLIRCAQYIPVYYEQASPSRDRRKFYFSFPRWNQSESGGETRIYRNGQIVNDNYQINYFKGCVVFHEPLLDEDVIHADYNFRFFSDDEIDTFLDMSVRDFNIFPPYSIYTINNFPDNYMGAVLYGAARNALRKMLLCLNFQQSQQIFGGAEESKSAFSNIETLKKNYEDEWGKMTEAKKFGAYPIMGVSATPLMSLPGGRSRWFSYLFS